jgi:hypothetical protein
MQLYLTIGGTGNPSAYACRMAFRRRLTGMANDLDVQVIKQGRLGVTQMEGYLPGRGEASWKARS